MDYREIIRHLGDVGAYALLMQFEQYADDYKHHLALHPEMHKECIEDPQTFDEQIRLQRALRCMDCMVCNHENCKNHDRELDYINDSIHAAAMHQARNRWRSR